MEPRTRDHLDVALRNREFAAWLLDSATDPPAPANEWAAIVAFYSAVHIVNAYLWEVHRVEPVNHRQRTQYLINDASLSAIRGDFRTLSRLGWSARYDPAVRLSTQRALEALDRLEQIINLATAELPSEE